MIVGFVYRIVKKRHGLHIFILLHMIVGFMYRSVKKRHGLHIHGSVTIFKVLRSRSHAQSNLSLIFRNLNQIWIVITLFRLNWHQMAFCFVPNQWEYGKFNPNLVLFKKRFFKGLSVSVARARKSLPNIWEFKPNLDCNYPIRSDLAPDGVPFCRTDQWE